MDFLAWLEQTGFSRWMRESPSLLAFPAVLVLHTVGMGFLVGTNVAIDLRVLGFASGIPLAPIKRFFPVMWLGFWVNALSGLALLIAYPTKALTNWVFYVKLALIVLAMASLRTLGSQVFGDPEPDGKPLPRMGRILAGTSLLLWVGAITAGRLLAYTYVQLMAGE